MNVMELAEKAVELKHGGYNCCQAVLTALSGETELSAQTLMQLGAGFGSGMGNMEATCGALVGAVMAAGLKGGTIRSARQISELFQAACGAVSCGDLKGKRTGIPICPCDDCVANAVAAYAEIMG